MTAKGSNGRKKTSTDILESLSVVERHRVLDAAHPRKIEKGRFLFHEARPASAMFYVLKGELKVTQAGADGREVLLRVVGPGETLAAAALLEGSDYPASAQALSAAEVLAWSGPVLAAIMDEMPRLTRAALELMIGRVHEMQERFREVATERVERRVAGCLVRLFGRTGRRVPEGILLEPALSREEIASMTGTTLFTVSRLLNGWARKGLLKCGRRRILIMKPHALVAIAKEL